MHSPAQSPILDVTETLSMPSDVDADQESKKNSPYPFPIPQNLGLPGLGFPGMITAKRSTESLPAFEYIAPPSHTLQALEFPLMELNRVGMIGGGMFPGFMHRRVRGEKRPIPEAQKDAKYFERRKRNNEAAKKSRDARKIREDRIAFRAALLEQENSILRAQVLALRDELQTVRQLLGATTAGGMLSMARQV
ncbi:D site-binding protein [Drosophila eugracilis]|uniref:D site-binding protein n=1 Tax=Drosophila eugracilis TaxID=29029 RepID=UPI0007E84F7C|nr:D site-binding protein [Drosophila eugracilis]